MSMVTDHQFKEKVDALYGVVTTLYGPYMCGDGRLRIDLKMPSHPNGYTMLYARLILEVKLGRRLTSTETVDHNDGDKTNDDPSNLKAISLSNNVSESVFRLDTQYFTCPDCGSEFELGGTLLRNAVYNRRLGKAGPFCSRSCAGRYGAKVQHGIHKPIGPKPISRTYWNKKGQTRIKPCE